MSLREMQLAETVGETLKLCVMGRADCVQLCVIGFVCNSGCVRRRRKACTLKQCGGGGGDQGDSSQVRLHRWEWGGA